MTFWPKPIFHNRLNGNFYKISQSISAADDALIFIIYEDSIRKRKFVMGTDADQSSPYSIVFD